MVKIQTWSNSYIAQDVAVSSETVPTNVIRIRSVISDVKYLCSCLFDNNIKSLKLFLRSAFVLQSAFGNGPCQLGQGYLPKAHAALSTLQTFYNETSGLWDTTGWWNGANCVIVLGDLAVVDRSTLPEASRIFANTFAQAPQQNLQELKVIKQNLAVEVIYGPHFPAGVLVPVAIKPSGFLNDYYDDEGWWALAWIQAYDLTNNPQYLSTAASIFEDMKTGASTPCGGIWWDQAQTYVNAIANELYLGVAAQLANRMPNKAYYLDIALQQWDWFRRSGMINSDGLINDGLTVDCKNNNGTTWSYIQGVILGALVDLNTASKNQSYLKDATIIATTAVKTLVDDRGILHDPCEPNCGADGAQFKGIFSRNLRKLQVAAPQDHFLSFITANAASIWKNNRNETNNRLGVIWSGPFWPPGDASTQSSALEAIVAAVAVDIGLGKVIAS